MKLLHNALKHRSHFVAPSRERELKLNLNLTVLEVKVVAPSRERELKHTLRELECKIADSCASTLHCVMSNACECRFCIKHATIETTYALAYLIERH